MISTGQFIFVTVAFFFAGLVDSVAGGGGLISLPALTMTGLPMHIVYGTNKFAASFGTTLSAIRYWKNKMADVPVGLISAICAVIGSSAAANIVLLLSDAFLHLILMILLPIIAVVVLFCTPKEETDRSGSFSKSKKFFFAAVIGLMIGAYDGMFGPGTGTLAILAYSMMMKYDLRTASGNAKFLNLASNYASLAVYFLAGDVNLFLAVPLAASNILGNFLGSGFAIQKGTKFIHKIMTVVVCLMFFNLVKDSFAYIY